MQEGLGTCDSEYRPRLSEGSQHCDQLPGCLDALHGIRAIACIAIVYGHCMFALGFAWPEQHLEWYKALEDHPWMLALVNVSEPAMDTFLILSGFLATSSLLPAMQSGKNPLQARAEAGLVACVELHSTFAGFAISFMSRGRVATGTVHPIRDLGHTSFPSSRADSMIHADMLRLVWKDLTGVQRKYIRKQ